MEEVGERRVGAGGGVAGITFPFLIDETRDARDSLRNKSGDCSDVSRTVVGVNAKPSGRWNPASSERDNTFRRGGFDNVGSLETMSSSSLGIACVGWVYS